MALGTCAGKEIPLKVPSAELLHGTDTSDHSKGGIHSLSYFCPAWQEQERRENFLCQTAREASSFAENKEIFSQNRMTDSFSACVKCCFKKRTLEAEIDLCLGHLTPIV